MDRVSLSPLVSHMLILNSKVSTETLGTNIVRLINMYMNEKLRIKKITDLSL